MNKLYQDIINSLNSKDSHFDSILNNVFYFQKTYNPLYKEFLELIGKSALIPQSLSEIPFCPISVFKHHCVQSGQWSNPERIFKSSGTMGARSRHYVRNMELYQTNAQRIFEMNFGPIDNYYFIGLLPNYLENQDSSLIAMVDYFMSSSALGGKYCLNNYDELFEIIERNKLKQIKTILFGVSFALLDYVDDNTHFNCDHLTVIETGGMKKFAREITKSELYETLRKSFSGSMICSEYGMTELLSQLYSIDTPFLKMNDRLRIVITDPIDPMSVLSANQKGRINIIDLANIDSLSFIATDDLGVINDLGELNVLGRIDNSDLRGCNYLI